MREKRHSSCYPVSFFIFLFFASALAESLLETAPNARARARLLASTARESGAWLNVLPISTLGLCMDSNTIRATTGLRLATPLCRTHSCIHCGEEVDNLATHRLSYRWSEGHTENIRVAKN